MSDLTLKSEKECEHDALSYWGKAYLKLPRVVLRMYFSDDPGERETGRIFFVLFAKCSYATGKIRWSDMEVLIHRGEYISTYSCLAQLTGISYHSLRHRMKQMQQKGMIRINRMKGGIRVYLFGYGGFTGGIENGGADLLTPFQQMAAYEERLRNGITY